MSKKVKNTRLFRKSLLVALVIFLVYTGFLFITRIINNVEKKTTKIQNYQSVGEYFLGMKKPVSLLLLFENNAEIRHGGGFIGTVGQIDVNKGKVTPKPIRSVYYYDYKTSIDPNFYLEPVHDGSGKTVPMNLRDSGQELNWPDNAERAMNIYEKESDSQVDGVVAITPDLLKTLLRWTGPVYLEDYKKTVTADNLSESVQLEVEAGQDKIDRKDPKSILSSVANVLMTKLSNQTLAEWQQHLPEVLDLLRTRKIVLYTKDPQVNQALAQLQFDGSLIDYNGDYLLISESNIGADKSTPFISEKLNRNIDVSPEGVVKEHLNLTRTHTSDYLNPYVDQTTGRGTWLVQRNITEIKLAVPAGTKLSAESENVDLHYLGREKSYDVYSFISSLDPLTSQDYSLSYELPTKLSLDKVVTYNSYQQYQVGAFPIDSTLRLQMPEGYQLQATNKQTISADEKGSVVYNSHIDQDEFVSFVYEKKQ